MQLHNSASGGWSWSQTIDRDTDVNRKQEWVDPSIERIDITRADAFIGRGADEGGNPTIDCQRS